MYLYMYMYMYTNIYVYIYVCMYMYMWQMIGQNLASTDVRAVFVLESSEPTPRKNTFPSLRPSHFFLGFWLGRVLGGTFSQYHPN